MMESSENYVNAAINNEVAIVASALRSTRNHTLNRAAFKLGTIPGMTTDTAMNALLRAAGANGYVKEHGEKATRQVIDSGFKNGQRNPRMLPANRPFSSSPIVNNRSRDVGAIATTEAPIDRPPTSYGLPLSTPEDEKGQPRLHRYGEDGPPVGSDEVRRHVYKLEGQARRIKIKVKPSAGRGNWHNVYRVVASDTVIGWQYTKPVDYRLIPYPPGINPFDSELADDDLFWPEGEKDAETLVKLGALAITFGGTGDGLPGGCESYFVGRNVIILADNDEGGRKHADQKAALISGVAKSLRVVHFSELPERADVSDWIALGRSLGDLIKRAEGTPSWLPPIATSVTPSSGWRSKSITADALRTKEFALPQVVLPGLICEGVTILASKPKVGKSWLALDVCIATAANRFTLGNLKPKTGDVLYLALEDSQRRLQRRVDRILSAVSESWPARLTMATEWRRIDEGGLDDIREWCEGVTEPRLVVIDTLAKIRPAKASNKAAYDVDYEAISGLHKIANSRGIAILIIHHTRKMEADDAFDTVSGTLGLTGAADSILVLDKRAGTVTLHARGRDIEESETALLFNKNTCRWTILGEAGKIHRSSERNRIINALTDAPDGLTVREIMALGEFSTRGPVDVLLSKMVKAGEIERARRGAYRLPDPNSSDTSKVGKKES